MDERIKIYDEKKNNYVAYNGKNEGESNKKCDRDALYSYIKNDINNIKIFFILILPFIC